MVKKSAYRWMLWFAVALCCAQPSVPADDDPFQARRERMIRDDIMGRGVTDSATLQAMRAVRRHEFVPQELVSVAYADRPLPIGHGQTISQPYIVAAMTELLGLNSNSVVLEVGTGSGYQAAILGEIAARVVSIEIIKPLAVASKQLLERLGYKNVHVYEGDGYYGRAEDGPYDGIIVTAAATHIPPPLIQQLKPGGRMVIPVGPVMQVQHLMLVEKKDDGSIVQRNIMPVRFVPLTGDR